MLSHPNGKKYCFVFKKETKEHRLGFLLFGADIFCVLWLVSCTGFPPGPYGVEENIGSILVSLFGKAQSRLNVAFLEE